ncbi:MAG: acyclic terpene utilization AtuA family protein [Rhizobiaceae bacterium]
MTRVLIPTGALGLGFDKQALAAGIAAQPDIIAIDGGSTDSGPFYLGTGTSKYSRNSTKTEWGELMLARHKAGVPLVIGSAGTCGADSCVDWMFDITSELAAELGQSVKVACLYSNQSAQRVRQALETGKLNPLEPAPSLEGGQLEEMSNIVALAGAEQIQAALATGADIVIAGRTTDTALMAAMPLAKGNHAGGAWHGAKVGECGAFCTTDPRSGTIMVEFDGEGFTVRPMAQTATCTAHTVSAHMLYENSNPFILFEPGGHLDVTDSKYHEIGDGRVRVTGSKWVPGADYTVKLEGSRIAGYQTVSISVLRDQRYVEHVEDWIAGIESSVRARIDDSGIAAAKDYKIEFRVIGQNSALGELETQVPIASEVGVMAISTARTQELANDIAKIINPYLLHHPLTAHEETPTFAFPFSPAEIPRGPLYEFSLNHVMSLDDPMDAFRLEVRELDNGHTR